MQQKQTIVGLGEVLWDVFPDGPRFGGAPANFACSAADLGGDRAEVFMVSSVGTDDAGERAIAALQEHRVNTSCLTTQAKQTGQVLIQLDEQGCASYEFAADTAWDNLTWNADLKKLAEDTDAVCFGTLGQRSDQSRETIRQFVETTAPAALRIFDINLRPPFVRDEDIFDSLRLASILKMNEDELPYLAALCGISGSPVELIQQLSARFELRLVALTRGAEGSVLVCGDQVSELAGAKTTVVDTVGAGDAFTASLALGLLESKLLRSDAPSGTTLDEINRAAASVAAFVCSQAGATPGMPDKFLNTLNTPQKNS